MTGSVILVQEHNNPSTDYFIRPLLSEQSAAVRTCAMHDGPEHFSLAPNEQPDVLFVRYLTPVWQRWIEENRGRLGRLVFFMDDDLFDRSAHVGQAWHYRWKLYRLAERHQSWLRKMEFELWVSNTRLAEKYAHWSPRPSVLTPQSPYTDSSVQKTLFYHGSATHKSEINWLLPVAEEVLAQDGSLSVELIGNKQTRALFSHLPRVHVVHSMPWESYRALLARPGRTIGLAPLLDGRFNQARSATKFFDITAAGAVGIYAAHPVYEDIVQHGCNGLLLPMEPTRWIDAILDLSANEARRGALLAGARSTLNSQSALIRGKVWMQL